MNEQLVTGIAAPSDPMQLEQTLADHGIDTTRLSIISKTKQSQDLEYLSSASHLSVGSTIMTGSTGTNVPGLSGGSTPFSSFATHAEVPSYLGGLPMIPADQAEHFNIAIAEGRSLVTYKATPEEAPRIEEAFRAAGLRNVKVFKPKVATTLSS